MSNFGKRKNTRFCNQKYFFFILGMKLIPPKNAPASGGSMIIKTEDNEDKAEDGLSNVEKLLKDTEILKPFVNK